MNPLARRWAASSALPLVIAIAFTGTMAQQRQEVHPQRPADDAVVQARPLFELAYTGLDDAALREARFRIIVRPGADAGETYTFDQRRARSGWAAGEPGTILYRPRHPLSDGRYEWEVALWDGTGWRISDRRFRVRVDSVPPAPVENLTVHRDRERGLVELEWDPVALDVEGRAEYVARYHVYRYPRADRTPSLEPYEVAETEQTRVTLPLESPEDEKIWFYRVTAEDLAGNEAGRPE